jgi:hypothetical protein
MGTQNASTGKALAYSLDLSRAYHFARAASKQMQDTGRAYNGKPRLARKADKDISREERAFKVDDPVGPFRADGIKGKVVLKGAGGQVTRDAFLVIRNNMQNPPGTIEHRTLR